MMLGTITKSPGEILDYDAEYDRWLDPGDTGSAVVEAVVLDATVTVDATSMTSDRVKVWLRGGDDGEAGTLKLLVNTTQGRRKQVSWRLRVKES